MVVALIAIGAAALVVAVFWTELHDVGEVGFITPAMDDWVRTEDVIVTDGGVEIPIGVLTGREILAALNEIDELTGAAA